MMEMGPMMMLGDLLDEDPTATESIPAQPVFAVPPQPNMPHCQAVRRADAVAVCLHAHVVFDTALHVSPLRPTLIPTGTPARSALLQV